MGSVKLNWGQLESLHLCTRLEVVLFKGCDNFRARSQGEAVKNVGESVGNIKAADGCLESMMKARGKQENEGEDGSDVNDVALFVSSA